MANDLATRIRDLVDLTDPVSAEEAVFRAERGDTNRAPSRGLSTVQPTRLRQIASGHARTIAAVAAAALILAGTGLVLSVPPTRKAAVPTTLPVVLTAAKLQRIVAESTVATASSGTATVTERSSQDGVLQSKDSIAVTFDASNIDEKITVDPEPAGSGKSFSTDDRLVGGQFYIDTPGPGDVLEWLHDANSAHDVASMQFPDPRSLYGALDEAANFSVTGTTTLNGTSLTHLQALDPRAIATSALGNLASGPLTSFSMWVDPNDVVQQMAFSSSTTEPACQFRISAINSAPGKGEPAKRVLELGNGAVSSPLLHATENAAGLSSSCNAQTTTSQVTIDFANLGSPEQVVAPPGAVGFDGKG